MHYFFDVIKNNSAIQGLNEYGVIDITEVTNDFFAKDRSPIWSPALQYRRNLPCMPGDKDCALSKIFLETQAPNRFVSGSKISPWQGPLAWGVAVMLFNPKQLLENEVTLKKITGSSKLSVDAKHAISYTIIATTEAGGTPITFGQVVAIVDEDGLIIMEDGIAHLAAITTDEEELENFLITLIAPAMCAIDAMHSKKIKWQSYYLEGEMLDLAKEFNTTFTTFGEIFGGNNYRELRTDRT